MKNMAFVFYSFKGWELNCPIYEIQRSPLETNMSPENQWLVQMYISYWNSSCLGDIRSFSGVYIVKFSNLNMQVSVGMFPPPPSWWSQEVSKWLVNGL